MIDLPHIESVPTHSRRKCYYGCTFVARHSAPLVFKDFYALPIVFPVTAKDYPWSFPRTSSRKPIELAGNLLGRCPEVTTSFGLPRSLVSDQLSILQPRICICPRKNHEDSLFRFHPMQLSEDPHSHFETA